MINLVAGAAVIAVCGVAMIATGPMGCCMAAVAAKGAFFGAVGGAVSGAIGGAAAYKKNPTAYCFVAGTPTVETW